VEVSVKVSPSQGMLYRIGRFSARHPWWVIGCWVIMTLVVGGLSRQIGGIYNDSVSLSGTQSQIGSALLTAHQPKITGFSGLVVVHSSRTSLTNESSVLETSYQRLAALPDVVSVTDPLTPSSPSLSQDGKTAYYTLNFSVAPKTLGSGYVQELDRATQSLRNTGIEVEYGGGLDQLTRPKASDLRSELVGFVVAAIVLIVSFGSLAGTFLPLLSAMFAAILGLGVLGLVAALTTFGTASPTLAAMIGLGVGIDYAVFLTTRFRQRMIDGADPISAAARTSASSGKAVLVAATTVSVALLGLYVSGITFIGKLGLAAVFAVATSAVASTTLVPAALGLLGRRIDRVHLGRVIAESSGSRDGWVRYAASVGRHPVRYLVVGVAVLGLLAIPLLSIRIGHVSDGADPLSYTDRRAYDLISSAFGPGANGPFTVVVDIAKVQGNSTSLVSNLLSDISHTADVAHVSTLATTPDGKVIYASVTPQGGPQDQSTTVLYNQLVTQTIPDALHHTLATGYLTGATATQIQFDELLTSRLPLIIAVVVATAFLLILSAFRSVSLAIKAAILNLLSIAASYGVVVAVFQWGWGRSIIGVSENVPIESYVPMIMFAIVFGLSMDYEIFLLSRVRELWLRTHRESEAVAGGLAATARVISSAALIMVSVFLAFVGSTNVVVKMLAIGLATSVLIDATVVRLLLVPAVMTILGKWSWWMPRWLDRVFPRIDPEGSADDDGASNMETEQVHLVANR
jgi:RND superfamily putative drug exporter